MNESVALACTLQEAVRNAIKDFALEKIHNEFFAFDRRTGNYCPARRLSASHEDI